jgi:hypothetical protein
MKFWISTIFIVGHLLICGSASGAGYCSIPVVPVAVDKAEAVFSGKIVDVVKLQKYDPSSRKISAEYVVKFEIEESWKGPESRDLQVLWRPEILGCPYFPVGEIGESYLVYAESTKSDDVGKNALLEITILNRTSKIPLRTEVFTQFGTRTSSRRRLLDDHIASELNRNDASDDIKVLRSLKECECLLADSLASCNNDSRIFQPRISSATSRCCTCLRRNRALPLK